jgi:hypothetical protein
MLELLGNLAENNIDNQVEIAEQPGLISAIVLMLNRGSGYDEATVKRAALVLWKLSETSTHRLKIAEAGVIPALLSMLCSKIYINGDVMRNVVGALSDLSEYHENQVAIATTDAIARLVQFLPSNYCFIDLAVKTIRNLSANSDNLVALAIAIPALVPLLSKSKDKVKEEALGALSNLSYNRDNQVLIAHAGAIPLLVSSMSNIKSETNAKFVLQRLKENENCSQWLKGVNF